MYGDSPGGDHGGMNDRYNGRWQGLGTPQQNASTNYTGGSTVGKGAKTPAPPTQPTPMQTAEATNWLNQQNYDRQQTTDAKATADKLAAENAQKAQTQSDIGAQYSAGQGYGANKLGSLGFSDTYGIMDRFNTSLNAAKNAVPGSATNVSSYFDPTTYWNNAINEATAAERGKLNTEYTNFTKPGYLNQDTYGFADTADDQILNAIMGEQEQSTRDTLSGNLARGTMSQGAYDYALNKLGGQKTASMSNLQNIGGGVLGGYRTNLGNTANQYGDRVTGYQLGQNMGIGELQGQLGTQRSGYAGGMEGDIRNALGDTKLFDLEKLISNAGIATGAGNTPLSTAFTNQNTPIVDPNRTTGTTGIF